MALFHVYIILVCKLFVYVIIVKYVSRAKEKDISAIYKELANVYFFV